MNEETRPPAQVALIVETSVVYGRESLKGVARFLDLHGRWSVSLDERELDAPPPDWLLDWTGREDVRDERLALLAHRGVLVSVAHGGGLTIESLYGDFVAREMTLIGSEYFACHELAENDALLKANRDDLGGVITHRMVVDEIGQAFELFWKGETGKVVIEQ